MNIETIKTGDIFYYDSYTAHDEKTHHHKCRVLFAGSESLFYDAWWEGLNEWTFVPVRKRLSYYRFRFTVLPHLTNLSFKGFEEIDKKNADKLYLHSPEILIRFTKDEILQINNDNTQMNLGSDTISFVPIGPKGGWLKPVLFDTNAITKGILIDKILEYQNLDFIHANEIVIDRIGLHSGVPSYNIRTH